MSKVKNGTAVTTSKPTTTEKTGPQVTTQVCAKDYTSGWYILTKNELIPERKIVEMRKHPTIQLVRQLVVAPVLAAHWSVEEKEGKAPEGAKQLIEENILPFRHELLRTSLQGCIDRGWLSYEKVLTLTGDNLLVYRKLKPMTQTNTDILVDRHGTFKGVVQTPIATVEDNFEDVYLKENETLLVNFDVEGTDWYGTSVFSSTEGPYDEYKNVQRATNRYDSKIAGTHWVVHYPAGSSELNGVETNNDEVAQHILATLEASGSIAVPRTVEAFMDDVNEKTPNAWDIELLSDMSQTSSNFINRLKYVDNLLVRTFGIPERAVLEGQHGTKAEAGTHTDAAVINMDMRHRTLVQIYNESLVDQLLSLNYGPEHVGSVYIVPAPILDSTVEMLSKLYEKILSDPQGFLDEYDKIDTEAVKSLLGVPYLESGDERHPHEFSLHRSF